MAYLIPRQFMNEGVTYNRPGPKPKERKEKPDWEQMRKDMGLPPADVPDAPAEPVVVHGLAGRSVVVPAGMAGIKDPTKPVAQLSVDPASPDDRSRDCANQVRKRLQDLVGRGFQSYDVVCYKTLVGSSANGGTVFIKIRIGPPPYGCVHARVYERSGRAVLVGFEDGKTEEEKIEAFEGPGR